MCTRTKVAVGILLAVAVGVLAVFYLVNSLVSGLGDPAVAESNVVAGTTTLSQTSPRREFNVHLTLDGHEMSIEDHLFLGVTDRDLLQVEMRDRDGVDVVTIELDTRTTARDMLEVEWTMQATLDGYGPLVLTVEEQGVVD